MPRPVAALLALLLLFAGAASAQTAAPDGKMLQGIVKSQIEAFRHDDAAGAYGFASPGIQAMFPTPDIFLGMVRQAYPPVYKPSSIAFGDVAQTPAGPVARVFLTAADGSNWIALYTFQQQPDGSWKISGCQLLKDTAPTI